MRLGLNQDQQQVPRSVETMPPPAASPTKEIPYDYVAKFKLQGRPGNRVQDVINISIEGGFVTVAIGYSFIPGRLPNQSGDRNKVDQIFSQVGNIPPAQLLPTLGNIPGLLARIGPILEAQPFLITTTAQLLGHIQTLVDPLMVLQCMLVRLCGIDFKYSIVDSGTGRELQNQAIHNIAGLGESSGNRPFRPLAKPMLFMPRSTIRIEVEEISEGSFLYKEAELYIVLHGYKILGYGTGLP
jgi:hypothetical protein